MVDPRWRLTMKYYCNIFENWRNGIFEKRRSESAHMPAHIENQSDVCFAAQVKTMCELDRYVKHAMCPYVYKQIETAS